ncbi:MAG: NPCBM/NEW2 domain-containing protein, partial [Planctomycetota bacterium]
GAFMRFQARIGIADALGLAGDCVVRILLDDKEVWQARIRGGDEPRAVDIDCRGAQVLALVVALGERYDIGDHVVFADARVIRTAQ